MIQSLQLKVIPKDQLQQFLNGQWIIFFTYSDVTYYYLQWYNTIQRPRFSSKKFCCFNDIIECNKQLDLIMKYISQFGLIVPDHKTHQMKHLEPTLIQLKVGKLDPN